MWVELISAGGNCSLAEGNYIHCNGLVFSVVIMLFLSIFIFLGIYELFRKRLIPHPSYDLPHKPKVRGMIDLYIKSKLMAWMKNKSKALDNVIDIIQTSTI